MGAIDLLEEARPRHKVARRIGDVAQTMARWVSQYRIRQSSVTGKIQNDSVSRQAEHPACDIPDLRLLIRPG